MTMRTFKVQRIQKSWKFKLVITHFLIFGYRRWDYEKENIVFKYMSTNTLSELLYPRLISNKQNLRFFFISIFVVAEVISRITTQD